MNRRSILSFTTAALLGRGAAILFIVLYMMLWGDGVASAQLASGGCTCGDPNVPFNPYGCPGSTRDKIIPCTPPTPSPVQRIKVR
jgi:hypothetical protein